jgi:hypothetical protein
MKTLFGARENHHCHIVAPFKDGKRNLVDAHTNLGMILVLLSILVSWILFLSYDVLAYNHFIFDISLFFVHNQTQG